MEKLILNHQLLSEEQLEAKKLLVKDSNSDRIWCCGLVDHSGLLAVGLKQECNIECYYSDSERIYINSKGRHLTCYLEFPLSESEIDIVRGVTSSDGVAALKAIITFAGDDLSVPDTHEKRWSLLMKVIFPEDDKDKD